MKREIRQFARVLLPAALLIVLVETRLSAQVAPVNVLTQHNDKRISATHR